MANEEKRLLDVDGEGFPYIEAGQGAPVILLHGALGDCRTWERQVRLLGRSARAIAYTQRYFGDAHWRPDGPPFGARCHGEDLIRFVEALGAGPVALVSGPMRAMPLSMRSANGRSFSPARSSTSRACRAM